MKKILLVLLILITSFATADAKVIKIKMADGSLRVYTSSELSAIDFNDDGTLTITIYDGQQLEASEAEFDEVEIGDEAAVATVYPDTLRFTIQADTTLIDLEIERPIMKMNYVYPSLDPDGQPITLSGTILIPEEIWTGAAVSQGIVMMNHYTKFNRDEAPTISNGELENMFMANPLKPNYIIVESDFYGFGATVRFPQAFLQGLNNARASLDGLLAARQLLTEQGIDYGPLCFNVGYSSGGFDALAAQKLRDMEYADRISFDKTFSGGGPSDVREAYRRYVINDSTAYNAVPLLLMVSTNETQHLGMDYANVFQPYICNRIDELILSKQFSSWPVCDSIGREKKIHEILTPVYCDLSSDESMAFQDILAGFNLTNDDWTPDTTQRIFLFHSRGDDYVPIQSARPMVSFLKDKGFKPHIIPGKTNLQTNFVLTKEGHLKATLYYFIQSLASIESWPLMYIGGQLNPLYATLINKTDDPVAIMRQLDALGIDCRTILKNIIAKMTGSEEGEDTELSPFQIIMMLNEQLEKQGLTMQDLYEMSDDSGIDIIKLITDLAAYFSEQSDDDSNDIQPVPAKKAARLLKAMETGATPADRNEQLLRDWMAPVL